MRGYVERMEMLEYFLPEGKEITSQQVMDSYLDDPEFEDKEEE